MALFRQQAQAEWLSLMVWSVIMAAMVFYFVILWQSLVSSGSMAELEQITRSLPESLRGLYGGQFGLTTLTGWLQAFGFGGWLSVPFIIYTALFVTGMITREMDRRTAEFLLALPVARSKVVLSRFAVLVAALAVLHLAHLAGVVAGVVAVGQGLAIRNYVVADLNSLLLMVALGGIFLVISVFIDDYGVAVGATLGVGLGLFFFHVATEKATGVLKALRDLLPLSFYDPVPILGQGAVPWSHMAVLAAISVATLGLSVFFFQRKQITA